MKTTALKLVSATALIAALFACGGGGGGTDNPTPIPTPIVNTAPIANAGPDQSVLANALVTLDGSASSDANSDPLTYAWTLSAKPPGSAAVLANPTSAKPTFTADAAGAYMATVVVNDGKINSNSDTVNIVVSVDNAAPVANAGVAQNVSVGSVVTLDGRNSADANGDPLTYAWTLASKPAGSTAILVQPTSVRPSLTADVAGTYIASLVVNDGKVNSNAATISIMASATPTPLSTTSPYITYPTSLDSNYRITNADATKAIQVSESAFVASPSNADGWKMQATYSQQGLFKVPVTKGYFYQFSTSSYWPPYLNVYDEAGYEIAFVSGSYSKSAISTRVLSIKSGVLYVRVLADISPVFKNADLIIDVNTASLGTDAGQQIDLSTFASGPNAGYLEFGFFGGAGNDRLIGKTQADNTIYGGAGDDVIEISRPSYVYVSSLVDGGEGLDTLVVDFPSAGITLKRVAAYGYGKTIPGTLTDSHYIVDKLITIRNIERIQFTDKTMDVSAMSGY